MIPFPQLSPSCLYRKLEYKLKYIDKNIKFSSNKNRTFSPSVSKVELYNKLFEFKDVDTVDYERKAILILLNIIRLYMTNEEKKALRKKWLKVK